MEIQDLSFSPRLLVYVIVTNEVERVLNAAVRMVSGIGKFDRGLTQLIHTSQ